MNNTHAQFNRRLAFLVLASFVVFALAVVLRVGIAVTPYKTIDSMGRPMGFNDPLDAEHYLIIVRNFRPTEFLRPEYSYEWLLLVVHLAGAILLISSRSSARVCRWYFLAQAILFPFGFLALAFLPFLLAGFFTGRMDREGFVDIPFIRAIAHPIWLVTSLFVAFALRGSSIGLSRVWSALTRHPMREHARLPKRGVDTYNAIEASAAV